MASDWTSFTETTKSPCTVLCKNEKKRKFQLEMGLSRCREFANKGKRHVCNEIQNLKTMLFSNTMKSELIRASLKQNMFVTWRRHCEKKMVMVVFLWFKLLYIPTNIVNLAHMKIMRKVCTHTLSYLLCKNAMAYYATILGSFFFWIKSALCK